MRVMLRRLLAILDGTPTGTRGQSLLEMTMTLPLLLVMLLGLAEIGWYANNYLTLLDVVREAGRIGSTRDPMTWNDGDEKKYQRMDCEALSDVFDKKPFENNASWPGPDLAAWGYSNGDERPVNYYDFVACSVIGNMAPLEFNDLTDDIVVSVFSFVMYPNQTDPNREVRIFGRYPARANECENDDGHDPFDLNRDGDGNDEHELASLYDSAWDNVRGYVFRGNHQHDYGGVRPCLGSEFSFTEVEELLDFSDDPDRARKIEQVANYGLVLVEIFWRHRQLFGLPWFNIGPLEDGQIIHVWTFFPVSGAEPNVDF